MHQVNHLAIGVGVNLLASASSDGTIVLWDLEKMVKKKVLRGHRKAVVQLCWAGTHSGAAAKPKDDDSKKEGGNANGRERE